jgi:DMSO/TMAO reductase YedYZ molybdopterin-dependent catalytic subunit
MESEDSVRESGPGPEPEHSEAQKEPAPATGPPGTPGRFKRLLRGRSVLIVAGVIVVVLLVAGAWTWHDEPTFCASVCHGTMNHYYTTYTDGGHLASLHEKAGVTCLDCHRFGLVTATKQVWAQLTGSYSTPLKQKDYGDKACLRSGCHDLKDTVHKQAIQKLPCSDCHSAHGTPSLLYSAQSIQNSAGVFPNTYYNRTVLKTGQRGCNACHKDALTPWLNFGASGATQWHVYWHPGYGHQDSFVEDCGGCHFTDPASYGVVANDLHLTHMQSPEFTKVYGGTCDSCHIVTPTGAYTLWDLEKYNLFSPTSAYLTAIMQARGIGSGQPVGWQTDNTPKVSATFSQNVYTRLDPNPATAFNGLTPRSAYQGASWPLAGKWRDKDKWTLTISGLGVPGTKVLNYATLKSYKPVTKAITLECAVNDQGGSLCSNVRYVGVPLKTVFAKLGIKHDPTVTCMNYVGDDNHWYYNDPANIWANKAYLVYGYYQDGKYNDLPMPYGGPVRLMFTDTQGTVSFKWIKDMTLTTDPTPYMGPQAYTAPGTSTALRDAQKSLSHSLDVSVFRPSADGATYKLGEPIHLEGCINSWYNGYLIDKLSMSTDLGQTWHDYPIQTKGQDPDQWVYWWMTWTPTKAGTFMLKFKADNGGHYKMDPTSLILTVK